MSKLIITDHCVKRYLERTTRLAKYENKIRGIVENGEEIRPTNELLRFLRHGCAETRYFRADGMIAVVVNDKVITVMPYLRKTGKGKWKTIQKQQTP